MRRDEAGSPATRSALIPNANEKADPRRQRRAMTEAELVKLLAVARERPLLDALTIRTGSAKASDAPTSGPKCGNGWNGSAGNGP